VKRFGFALLAVASIFLMASVALADVAVSVNNSRKGNCVRLDFPAGTTATRDPQDVSMHIGFAKMTINGVRDSNAGGYEYFSTIQGNITGINTDGTNGAKTYGLYINMTRQLGVDTLVGDLQDAGLKIRVKNSAGANTAGNTLSGLDVQARNGATGLETGLEGGLIAVQTDSGGTTTSARALRVETTLNGTVTGVHIPLDVRSFRQSAGVPTIEAAERISNGNTTGSGITGLLFNSESAGGASAYYTNVIDMSSATVTTAGAQVRFTNGACIFVGSLTTRDTVRAAVGTCSIGSIYLSSAGKMYLKVANNAATADWALVSHTDAD
jgi:hypothetical protein